MFWPDRLTTIRQTESFIHLHVFAVDAYCLIQQTNSKQFTVFFQENNSIIHVSRVRKEKCIKVASQFYVMKKTLRRNEALTPAKFVAPDREEYRIDSLELTRW